MNSPCLYDEDVNMEKHIVPAKEKVQDVILAQPKVQGVPANETTIICLKLKDTIIINGCKLFSLQLSRISFSNKQNRSGYRITLLQINSRMTFI
jgi:hypothetical protein